MSSEARTKPLHRRIEAIVRQEPRITTILVDEEMFRQLGAESPVNKRCFCPIDGRLLDIYRADSMVVAGRTVVLTKRDDIILQALKPNRFGILSKEIGDT